MMHGNSNIKFRITVFIAYAQKLISMRSREFYVVKAEIQAKKYYALQGKCPSLLTDHNHTYCVYSACA